MAELKGTEPEFALVGAHYCSWFDGSTDNVTGDACVLELARVLKKFDGKLRYGLRFCWWPGHSHGRYSGSTWYADTYWHDLHDHGIVYFNIDSPGVKGATVYVPRHQMAEVSEFNEAMTTEVTGWSTLKSANAQLALGKRGDKYVSSTRPSRAADQSFWGIGVSSMSVYAMLTPEDANRDHNVGGSGGAWWWHSEHETIDKFDPAVLVQDTRLYASILLRLATADVLPFKLAAITGDYLDSLREFDEEAGNHLPFKPLIGEVEALQEKLAAFDARAAKLTKPADTAAANRTILRIARLLNPVLYQVCSPFEHDPALGSRALPSLTPALKLKSLNPDGDAFKFTVTGLKRRINQISPPAARGRARTGPGLSGDAHPPPDRSHPRHHGHRHRRRRRAAAERLGARRQPHHEARRERARPEAVLAQGRPLHADARGRRHLRPDQRRLRQGRGPAVRGRPAEARGGRRAEDRLGAEHLQRHGAACDRRRPAAAFRACGSTSTC